MTIRKLALLPLTITALALGGCSSGAEPEAAPPQAQPSDSVTSEPTGSTTPPGTPSAAPSPEVVHAKVPRETRRAHFPRPDAGYRTWLSDIAITGSNTSTVSRRVLPCDDARIDLGIDRRVLAHVETVFEEGDYLVSRQLTLYPDAATADEFVSQLSETRIGCTKLMGSSELIGVHRLDYGPDRFFRTQDRSVVFSETGLSYGDNQFVFVDIINQRDNAILFTRVGLLNGPVTDDGVIMAKEENSGFVREVRGQADRATGILRRLPAS